MTKQNTMTRAMALEFAIDTIRDAVENGITESDGVAEIEVLRKMHDSITKPRKKSDAPSKARVENLALVDAAVAAMGDNEVNAKWLTEHVRGILTTQKAAAVMRLGVETGKVHKIVDGRKVSYKVA